MLTAHPAISEHIVMLYYDDLSAARHFYGDILRLERTMDNDWAAMYRVTPKSFIATIKTGGEGAYHQAQETNAVMVSIATDDIEAWYHYLRNSGELTLLKDIYNAKTIAIRAFLVRDPGGYSVEFFQWL